MFTDVLVNSKNMNNLLVSPYLSFLLVYRLSLVTNSE